MRPIFYIVCFVLFLAGGLWWALERPGPLRGVHLLEENGTESVSAPTTSTSYALHVDSVDGIPGKLWFWEVEHGGSLFSRLEGRDPSFLTKEPGDFVFTATVDSRVVARDTVTFTEVEKHQADVVWPSGVLRMGDTVVFEDRSTYVGSRQWMVQTVDDKEREELGDAETAVWIPKKPGRYRAQVELIETVSGDTIEYVHELVVERRGPLPAVERKRQVDPNPQVKPPSPAPVIPALRLPCFAKADRAMVRGDIVKFPLSYPKESEMLVWKGSPTVFEVISDRTCQLVAFSFWGNNNASSGDATITLTCLEPGCITPTEKGKSFQIQGTLYVPQSFPTGMIEGQVPSSSNMPVLQANHRYRVKVKPDSGAPILGYFPLEKSEYAQGGVKVTFLQQESGIFNIVFRTN